MKYKAFRFAAVILLIVAINVLFPVRDLLLGSVEWFRGQGAWGAAVYVLSFVACSLFFVPVGPLLMLAGIVYGFGAGYGLAAVSALTGVSVSYALGKKLWRARVERLRLENPRFELIYEAISRRGTLLVFLIRLNPFLPFSLVNYLFTIPKLDFRKYLLSSFLGMSPDILFYLYVGRVGRGWLDASERPSVWSILILAVALLTTVVAGIIINNLVRKTAPSRPALQDDRPGLRDAQPVP